MNTIDDITNNSHHLKVEDKDVIYIILRIAHLYESKIDFSLFDKTVSNCEGVLGAPSVAYTRQIIDIPVIQYEVVAEHVVFKRYCFNCRKRSYPKVNLSQYVLGKGRIGINLMSAIFTMRQDSDMSVNQIKAHLKSFYHLELSLGEIIEILHQEADLGEGEVEKIKQKLLLSKVSYADET